jgi:diadenosine tetraphosphate (Ap4A) HIT family hydrolase
MGNAECLYCARDQRVDDLMIEVAPLAVSTLFLFKEQSYPGRCVVAYKDHKRELYDLDPEELGLYMKDVARAEKAIARVFSPDKINCASFGDRSPHLHFHLVPKYEGGPDWGDVFRMLPKENRLLESSEYQALIARLKSSL